MSRRGTETRQLTEQVKVRFKTADLDMLKTEAARRGISVPELLRDSGLRSCTPVALSA